jgi:hypothetical protein
MRNISSSHNYLLQHFVLLFIQLKCPQVADVSFAAFCFALHSIEMHSSDVFDG